MAIVTLGADQLLLRYRASKSERTIRTTFQGWLAVVMTVAYMVSGAIGYTSISGACLQEADRNMLGRLEYLAGQLSERDKMLDGIARRTKILPTILEEVHASSMGGVATGIDFGSEIAQGVPETVQSDRRVIEAYLGISEDQEGKSNP